MQFDSERISERISEWYKERLKSIGNENEDTLKSIVEKEAIKDRWLTD